MTRYRRLLYELLTQQYINNNSSCCGSSANSYNVYGGQNYGYGQSCGSCGQSYGYGQSCGSCGQSYGYGQSCGSCGQSYGYGQSFGGYGQSYGGFGQGYGVGCSSSRCQQSSYGCCQQQQYASYPSSCGCGCGSNQFIPSYQASSSCSSYPMASAPLTTNCCCAQQQQPQQFFGGSQMPLPSYQANSSCCSSYPMVSAPPALPLAAYSCCCQQQQQQLPNYFGGSPCGGCGQRLQSYASYPIASSCGCGCGGNQMLPSYQQSSSSVCCPNVAASCIFGQQYSNYHPPPAYHY